jgi:hypothetical protein
MKRRLTPWLLAGVIAVAFVAGVHGSPWSEGSASSDAPAPFAAVGRAAVTDAPAAQLVQRELGGAGRHVLAKFGIAASALAVLAFGLWLALQGERRTTLRSALRDRVFIRGPPAPSFVI